MAFDFVDRFPADEAEQGPPPGDYWGNEPGFDRGDLIDAPLRALGAGLTVLDTPGRFARTALSSGDLGQAWDALWDPEKAVSATDLRRQYLFDDVGEADGNFDAGDVVDTGADLLAATFTDPLSLLSFGATQAGKNVAGAGQRYLQATNQAKRLGPEAQTAVRNAAVQRFERDTGKALGSNFIPEPGWTGQERGWLNRLQAGETGVSVGIPFTNLRTAATPVNSAAGRALSIAANPFEAGLGIAAETTAGKAAIDWARRAAEWVSQPSVRDAGGAAIRQGEQDAVNEVNTALQQYVHPAMETLAKAGVHPDQWKLAGDLVETIDPLVKAGARNADGAKGAAFAAADDASSAGFSVVGSDRLKQQYKQAIDQISGLPAEQRAALYSAAEQLHGAGQYLRERMVDLGISADGVMLGAQVLKRPDELRSAIAKTKRELAEAEKAAPTAPTPVTPKGPSTPAIPEGEWRSRVDAAVEAAPQKPEIVRRKYTVERRRLAELNELSEKTIAEFGLQEEAKLGAEALQFQAQRVTNLAQAVATAGSAREIFDLLREGGETIADERTVKQVFKVLGLEGNGPIQWGRSGTGTYPAAMTLWNKLLYKFPDGPEVLAGVREYYKRGIRDFSGAAEDAAKPLSNIPIFKHNTPDLLPEQSAALERFPELLGRGEELSGLSVEEARRLISELIGDSKAAVQADKGLRALKRAGVDWAEAEEGLRAAREANARRFLAPEEAERDALIAELGLSPAQYEKAKGRLFARDNVTGFYEGRTGSVRINTAKRLADHVAQTGEPAIYAVMDLKNLGGMNAKLGDAGANKVYSEIAQVLKEELEGLGGQAQLFRHGGDEMSGFISGVDQAAVDAALLRAKERVKALEAKHGLADAHKIDTPNKRGIGIHAHTRVVQPGDVADEYIAAASKQLEAEKLKGRGQGDGAGKPDSAAGAGTSTAKAGGAAGRAAADRAGAELSESVGRGADAAGAGRGGATSAGRPDIAGGHGRDASVGGGKLPAEAGAGSELPLPGAAELSPAGPAAALTGLRETLKSQEAELADALRKAREVPSWMPFRADPDVEVAKPRKGVSSYASASPNKGRQLGVFGSERPELTGVPMTRQEAEAFIKRAGTHATLNETPAKGLSVWEATKNYFTKGGLEGVKKAAAEQTEFFISNPVEAMARHIMGPYAKAVKNSSVKQGFANTFRAIEEADWDRVVSLAREAKASGEKEAYETALKEFKGKYGTAFEDLAGGVDPADAIGPAGFAKMPDWAPGKNVFLPAAAKEKFDAYLHYSTKGLGETAQALAAPLLAFMKVWKPAQTWAWPVFHIRNQASDLFRMLQTGAVDAGTAGDMAKLWAPFGAIAGKELKGFTEPKHWAGQAFDLGGGKQIAGDALLREAQELGVIGNGYVNEILMDASETAAKRWKANAAGAGVGQSVKNLGANGWSKYKSVLGWREDSNRVAAYLARRRAGDAPLEAALKVEEALFNYSRLSPAADWLRKTGIAPFASWMSKNIPAQVQALAENPAAFMAMVRGAELLDKQQIPEHQLPDYMRDKYAIVVNQEKDENGKEHWTYVTPNGVIPVYDLVELSRQPKRMLLEQLGPFAQMTAGLIDEDSRNDFKDADSLLGKFNSILADVQKAGTVDPKTGRVYRGLAESAAYRTLMPLSARELNDVEGVARKSLKTGENRVNSAQRLVERAKQEYQTQADSGLFAPEQLQRYAEAIRAAELKLARARQTAAEEARANERVLKRVRSMELAP